MQVLNFTELRKNLSHTLDYVEQSHAPVVIKRNGHSPVVIISLDEYNAHMETMYLLSNPHNAQHLMRGIKAVQNHQLLKKGLIEE